MAANPDPSRVTEPMWWLWQQFQAIEPTVQLGGIFANKPGYHNTRNGNNPSDYSVGQYALDRQGPPDKAAAIDLTFPSAQAGRYDTIAKYSTRLLRSGQDPKDERGNFLREFYGQTNSDAAVEGWDFQAVTTSTSDTSHLWHIHISVMRAYVDDPRMARAVLSILAGQTVEAWRAAEAGTTPTTTEDDMTPEQAGHFAALIWRTEALIANRPVVAGGPTAGEVNQLAVAMHDAAAPTPVTVDPATLAGALQDPAFLAALAKAVNDDTHARMAQ